MSVRKLCRHSKVDSLSVQGTERASGQAESVCGQESSGEQCGCTVACGGSNVSLVCTGGG